jgi:hypothetical protein
MSLALEHLHDPRRVTMSAHFLNLARSDPKNVANAQHMILAAFGRGADESRMKGIGRSATIAER